MKFSKSTWAAVGAALLVAACGGGGDGGNAGSVNNNPGRGTLVQSPPPRTLSLSAAEFSGELIAAGASGQTLLQLATGSTSGTLPCGIDVHYIKYGTVGGKGEATQASAALMVPTGPGANCSGARPIVLHAHGTAVERRYNLADFIDATNPAHGEQTLVASQLAAKGYIVVAPNYAGYDSSPLPYHPFLVADQQSKDMIDALTAARTALPSLLAPVSDNGKLFITGISQGGHVAMATLRAMRALNMTVTATAPLEPVSSLLNYGDAIISGQVPAGSTTLMPMVINGYQKTYGTIYSAPTDYYSSTYAAGIEAAFPGNYTSTTLITSGIVPAATLFSGGAASSPAAFAQLFAGGVGPGNLITDTARSAYATDIPNATPTNALRSALKLNDVLSMTVDKPMMLCGGAQDPTVFFYVNADYFAATHASNPYLSILDLENTYPVTNSLGTVTKVTGATISALQAGFQQAKIATQAAAPTDPLAVVKAYHGSLVPPFCLAAASGYFANF
ncbi:alpha/beta hydrolase [Rhodoferax sp. GW822-FHT02A01]|uniref:alpha/beta hydrolase family protein n=1 Tax=Rhodoferax sp. GW822-FHT02A01 TaxID=3141537 RepID=UPI00315DF79F